MKTCLIPLLLLVSILLQDEVYSLPLLSHFSCLHKDTLNCLLLSTCLYISWQCLMCLPGPALRGMGNVSALQWHVAVEQQSAALLPECCRPAELHHCPASPFRKCWSLVYWYFWVSFQGFKHVRVCLRPKSRLVRVWPHCSFQSLWSHGSGPLWVTTALPFVCEETQAEGDGRALCAGDLQEPWPRVSSPRLPVFCLQVHIMWKVTSFLLGFAEQPDSLCRLQLPEDWLIPVGPWLVAISVWWCCPAYEWSQDFQCWTWNCGKELLTGGCWGVSSA